MDKKTAENYVIYGIKSMQFSKKICTCFLPFNILLLVIAALLYYNSIVIILVLVLIAINVISTAWFKFRWSAINGFLSQATQLLLFAIALNFINFCMYKRANAFIWYEYIISIGIQIFSIFICIIIMHLVGKQKHEAVIENIQMRKRTTSAIAALFYMIGGILCKIFLTEAALHTVITIISVLMNLLIILLNYPIVSGYYRAYLIKKYNMEFDLR